MDQGTVVQGHLGVQELPEGIQLLPVGQVTGKQQVGHFLEPQPLLLPERRDQFAQLIPAVEELSFHGRQAAVLLPPVADDVADIGQAHQDTRPVLVPQAALDAVLGEEGAVDPAGGLDPVRQLVYQIILVHLTRAEMG